MHLGTIAVHGLDMPLHGLHVLCSSIAPHRLPVVGRSLGHSDFPKQPVACV